MAKKHVALGVDVGGSGIKGAPVNLDKGEFSADRLRIPTPSPATPEAVADVIAQILDHFDDVRTDAPVGVTIPGVVTHGVVRTAANIDPAWVGCDAAKLFADRLGHKVRLVNDADAAGVAELEYGAARKADGLVVLTTLGTGIGTALINDGALVPNSELGHLQIGEHADYEKFASSGAREAEDLSFEDWAPRLQAYYAELEKLLWPDLFVVGGGISSQAEKYLPLLDLRTPIVPAKLKNKAGIIGAAALAARA